MVPTNPKELFKAGMVREAIEALTVHLRERPSDTVQRTFLFELLCFAGEFSRAEKQLAVLASGSPEKETGAIVYYAALHAEKTRHDLFEKNAFPSDNPDSLAGELNGRSFQQIFDADSNIGARLEVFAAGAYVWLPFQHLASLEMRPPQHLRDTLWSPALVQTAPTFRGTDLGEVLIPAIYPFSWKQSDGQIWLGRKTEYLSNDAGVISPVGQKTLLVDDEEFPFLEVRSLTFSHKAETPSEQ